MTREIKFRCYDPVNKSFSYWTWNKEGFNLAFCLNPQIEVEVSQFTGLLDKNGKEIYEGDILSCPAVEWRYPHGEYKGVVDWESGNFYVRHSDGVGEALADLIEVRGGKVIGNIFENPNLLT